jgi:hypothetical protein
MVIIYSNWHYHIALNSKRIAGAPSLSLHSCSSISAMLPYSPQIMAAGSTLPSALSSRQPPMSLQCMHQPCREAPCVRPCSAICVIKHRKNVHGACLGNCLTKQPQQLLIPERRHHVLRREPRHIVQPELEPAHPAGPCKDLIAHREQHDPALPTSGTSASSPSPTASSAPECTVRRCCCSSGDAACEGAREVGQSISTSALASALLLLMVLTSTSISVVPVPGPASMRE